MGKVGKASTAEAAESRWIKLPDRELRMAFYVEVPAVIQQAGLPVVVRLLRARCRFVETLATLQWEATRYCDEVAFRGSATLSSLADTLTTFSASDQVAIVSNLRIEGGDWIPTTRNWDPEEEYALIRRGEVWLAAPLWWV